MPDNSASSGGLAPAWRSFRASLAPSRTNRLAARRRLREHRSMGTASSDAVDAGFLIRKPCAGEERELAELHVECWRQTYSRLLPPGYFSQDLVGQRLPMWQNIVAISAERPVVVAERDGVLIGFALAGANPPGSSPPAGVVQPVLARRPPRIRSRTVADRRRDRRAAGLPLGRRRQSTGTSLLRSQPVPPRRCRGHQRHRPDRSAPNPIARAGRARRQGGTNHTGWGALETQLFVTHRGTGGAGRCGRLAHR